jgi:cytochrome P450
LATYHLLATPRILAKLKTELQAAIPDPDAPIALPVLEKLPYLVAVVQEAIRLSYGVASRLQRISPEKALTFKDTCSGKQWCIPPNTPVSMTSVLIHHDESIFADASSFIPERWIENPRLDRYMVSFSKGSRQCLGINLAYAEIYLCLSKIFLRFGSGGESGVRMQGDEGVLELFKTGPRDVEIEADGFAPLAAEGSQGVRVLVKS